ncbi:hypothetical protein BHM03_00033764 [Ensete ventricosum]|nr:hypothetical protein BHM03_00033764 [Ensete ventricosum]
MAYGCTNTGKYASTHHSGAVVSASPLDDRGSVSYRVLSEDPYIEASDREWGIPSRSVAAAALEQQRWSNPPLHSIVIESLDLASSTPTPLAAVGDTTKPHLLTSYLRNLLPVAEVLLLHARVLRTTVVGTTSTDRTLVLYLLSIFVCRSHWSQAPCCLVASSSSIVARLGFLRFRQWHSPRPPALCRLWCCSTGFPCLTMDYSTDVDATYYRSPAARGFWNKEKAPE